MRRQALILALSEDLSETRALISSLGYVVTSVQVQNLDRPDPQTYFGSGRVEEVSRAIAEDEIEAEVAVVPDQLEPVQVLRLETQLGVRVYDRVRLILEIFADRAHNEEAKLQVELARLQYELPLVRETLRQLKQGERPGYQAGGATAYETQVKHLEGRRKQIRDELERLKRDRQVRRNHRRHGGFWQVSLAGYTNAGKSTLLNALTQAHVTTENRLFSTLETRTRRVVANGASNSRVLMTDTVGFIEDLPPWLVEAFHATLEEVAFSDLVLLIVDGSDPMEEIERKLSSSLDILRGFLAERGRLDLAENIFLVVNKTDRAPQRDWADLAERFGLEDRYETVSARTDDGVPRLLETIREAIPGRRVVDIDLPYSGDAYALIDKLDEMGELEDVDETATVTARVALSSAQVSKVEDEVDELDGRIEPVP